MPPRKGAFSRLLDHFHTHPQGRLHEMLFWGGLGVAFMAFAFFGWRLDWLNEPIAWILGIVGLCMFGFALLPQKKKRPAHARPLKGKRAQIAQQVRASKSERKRKDDGLPPPPLRRG